MPPIKKKVMQNPNTTPAATNTKEETTMVKPIKRVPTKAPAAVATAPVKAAAPVKKAPAAPVKKAPAAPVAKAPVAKAVAAPKKTVAAPVAKAVAKTTTKKVAAPKQRAVLGGKSKNPNKTVFEINEGGRTTRDSFNHLAWERINAAGIPVDSKKTVTDVVNIIENLLVDITTVSSIKFMNAMFKRSWNKARVYDLPTTEHATLVPAHFKVQYSRYAELTPEDFLKGQLLEDGSFLPLGEDEAIIIGEADSNPEVEETEEVIEEEAAEEFEGEAELEDGEEEA